jgi:hypothetical protein
MWANPIVGGIKLRVENLSRTKTQFNLLEFIKRDWTLSAHISKQTALMNAMCAHKNKVSII